MLLGFSSRTKWSLAIAALVAAATAYAQTTNEQKLDLGGYWQQPLEPQGLPPAHWSDIEKSLAPTACGQCHTDLFAQWRTSRHAQAMSPGVLGQLVTFEPGETAECMQCHAPLAEQRMAFEAARGLGLADRYDQLGIAAAGIPAAAATFAPITVSARRNAAAVWWDRAPPRRFTTAPCARNFSRLRNSVQAAINSRTIPASTASRWKTHSSSGNHRRKPRKGRLARAAICQTAAISGVAFTIPT
jgi:hypothetical protein